MSTILLTFGSLSDSGRTLLACGVLTIATLAGCGEPDRVAERDDMISDTTRSGDFNGAPGGAADRAREATVTGPVLRAELEALGGTDVIGSVSLTPGPAGTAVSVAIHGANSGLPYVAELIGGTCAGPGGIITELGQITAGEAGDGEFHEVVDTALLGGDRASRAVRVRGASDPAAIVACGDLR